MLKQTRFGLLVFSTLTVLMAGQLIASVSQAQEKYITPGDAASHLGEVQTVCGEVGNIQIETLQPTIIKLYQQANTKNFTIVIFPCDRAKFTQPPLYSYLGKEICVTGMIKTYSDEPEIILTDPSQITTMPSP